MNTIMIIPVMLAVFAAGVPGVDAAPVFGPVKYEVKQRYGKENRSQASFRTAGGLYVIRVQNGTKRSERPDILEVRVNGTELIGPEQGGYSVLACFLHLEKENTVEINLMDQKPSGMKRPPVNHKFVVISVEPVSTRFPEGVYGLDRWERLKDLQEAIRQVQDDAPRAQAIAAVDLRRTETVRIEAVRTLGERKNPQTKNLFLLLYQDLSAAPAVRAEAAISLGMLGDTAMVPLLADGLIQSNNTVREGAARALSFYPEEATRQQLSERLERVDSLRKTAIIRAIVTAGWKPYATIEELAVSPDDYVAAVAIELLGNMKEQRATDRLFAMLRKPDKRNKGDIIRALGASGDARVLEALLEIAKDPKKREGLETSLATAFVLLGDRQAGPVIEEMADTIDDVNVLLKLRDAHWKLMEGGARQK